MIKKSVTNLMNQQHEVHRLENLFFKQVESAYYFKNFGIDWNFFNDQNIEISVTSFVNYFTQEAIKHGIVITDIKANIKNFTLSLQIKLLSEEITFLKIGIK